MTATLALPPVLAAAVVNGLCNVAVLNGVPCPRQCHHPLLGVPALVPHCDCGGSGTVAPSVAPGQRIAIAAVGELPKAEGRVWAHGVEGGGHEFYVDLTLPGDKQFTPIRLHTRKVVGSAVATTPAVPIVGMEKIRAGEPRIVSVDGQLNYWDGDRWIKLEAALPWLPSDLVGRWAVLVENAATTEQRCPTCWGVSMTHCDCGGSTLHMGHPCPTCKKDRTCPPVPLPDGFDPEPYTLTEQELT